MAGISFQYLKRKIIHQKKSEYWKTMNISKTEIEGVLTIEPRLFRDARGYFFESFSEREFGKSPLARMAVPI